MVSTERPEEAVFQRAAATATATCKDNGTTTTAGGFQREKHRQIKSSSNNNFEFEMGRGGGMKTKQSISRESEEELLQWISERRASSIPATMDQTIQAARLIFGLRVGKAWYFSFVKRHPEIQPTYWWKMQS